MNCNDFREIVSDLLDGDIAPDAQARAEAHLGACGACSALRTRLEGLVADLASLGDEPAPDGLADRVLAHVPRVAPRTGGLPARRPWELRRVAGWGLILIALGWQAGGGALAGQAMTSAAPVLADARQAVERARKQGLTGEIERAGAGVTELARSLRNAQRILNPSAAGRPTT